MLYREEFLMAIETTLSSYDHYQIGNNFYIYKPEAEMLCEISFDVMNGASDFEILGGATTFCNEIEWIPPIYDLDGKTGWLRVWCPSVREYSQRQGFAVGDNVNLNKKGLPQRYTKEKLRLQLQKNAASLERLLSEWEDIKSIYDYYLFAIKQSNLLTGSRLFPPVPFPSIDSFFLSIRVGKMREASTIYIDLLRKSSEEISTINAYLPAQPLRRAIEKISSLAFPITTRGLKDRRAEETRIIKKLLTEYQDILLKEAMERVANGRKTCENFLHSGMGFFIKKSCNFTSVGKSTTS